MAGGVPGHANNLPVGVAEPKDLPVVEVQGLPTGTGQSIPGIKPRHADPVKE